MFHEKVEEKHPTFVLNLKWNLKQQRCFFGKKDGVIIMFLLFTKSLGLSLLLMSGKLSPSNLTSRKKKGLSNSVYGGIDLKLNIKDFL